MPWWLRRLIDLLNLLALRLSRRRYDVLARRIGRPPTEGEPAARRRFIAIQVDGLAHEHLLAALELGYAPTIQRLIGQGHRLQRWRCGLPSSTAAVQAGIMYGNNWDLPAFRWYEKDAGFAPTCRNPGHVERIKPRVAADHPGILAGGSSYGNMFDGDARLALFTLSAMGRQRFFEHLRGLGWALLFALNPWTTLHTVGLALWELLRDIAHTVSRWLRDRFHHRLRLGKPFLKVLSNIIFGQIQTFGILLDIYRGMPAIYVDYYGYDEVAHEDGPLGHEALRALKRIDAHIREMDRVRRAYQPDMELYILADHGLTPSTPFEALYGQSIGQLVARAIGGAAWWEEGGDRQTVTAAGATAFSSDFYNSRVTSFLLDELAGIEPHLTPRGRRLVQMLRDWVERRTPPEPEADWNLARTSDVVVRSSGSLTHIYFNVTQERMNISEIAILYPDLIDTLNDHPGIGLALGLEGGHPMVVTAHGTAALSVEWLQPGLAEPEQTVADLARLLSFPHSGDLMLLGAWDSRGRVITFEEQNATHGGIAGPQEYPFFLSPPNAPLDVSQLANAEQLYPYFRERYHSAQPETE